MACGQEAHVVTRRSFGSSWCGPIYCAGQYGVADNEVDVGPEMGMVCSEPCQFFEAVAKGTEFSPAQLRSMSGNSMVVAVVAAVQMFVIACTVPVTPV